MYLVTSSHSPTLDAGRFFLTFSFFLANLYKEVHVNGELYSALTFIQLDPTEFHIEPILQGLQEILFLITFNSSKLLQDMRIEFLC